MIEAIREAVIYLAHTHDGARVAMHCLWHGTPKVLFRFCLPSPLIVVQSETVSLIAHMSASTHFDAVKYFRARLKSGPALPIGKYKQQFFVNQMLSLELL